MTARRAFVLLMIFIVLGAAVNVPLAVPMLRSRTDSRGDTVVNEFGREAASRGWPHPTPHGRAWPAPTQWMEHRAFGYCCFMVYGSRFQMQVELIGWPLPVFERVQMWWPWEDPNWQSSAEPDPAMRLHWAGVLVNPLLWGIAAWLVLIFPFLVRRAVRRTLRIRRSRCPACGYPTGSSAVCTECGAELPESIRPAVFA